MPKTNSPSDQKFTATDRNKLSKRRKILSLLHTYGNMSASELGKHLKISLPTCIALLNDMVSFGYVKVSGIGESSGGRKPTLYGLPDDSFYVASCDLGRFTANVALFDCNNRFVSRVVEVDTHIDDPKLVEKLHATVTGLLGEYQIPEEKLYGIGADMPGLVDSKAGTNFTIKDPKFQKVGKDLMQRFGRLVYIDNDARMHAFGEFHFGAAQNYKDAMIIHWSWGLGLGIFVNGQLYSGSNGFAGEFSHIPIVDNGDLCICGKRGCLETLASSNTIMKRLKEGFESNEISALINHFKANPEKATPEDVIDFARQGDEFCISILSEIGTAMGKGLSYIIQLLNPEVIVLSGPISRAKQYVMSPVQQSLNRLCLEKISGNTRILVSDMGDQTALLGTSKMVFQKVFSEFRFMNDGKDN